MAVYKISTSTLGLSQAQDNRWNSVVGVTEHDGDLFVVSNGYGLFEVSGNTDHGSAIVGYITTGELSLAGPQSFNCPKATLIASGTGSLQVARYTKEQGSAKTPNAYSVTLTSEQDEHEVLLETRQHARTYQFKITMTGSGNSLDSFGVYVNPVRPRRG